MKNKGYFYQSEKYKRFAVTVSLAWRNVAAHSGIQLHRARQATSQFFPVYMLPGERRRDQSTTAPCCCLIWAVWTRQNKQTNKTNFTHSLKKKKKKEEGHQHQKKKNNLPSTWIQSWTEHLNECPFFLILIHWFSEDLWDDFTLESSALAYRELVLLEILSQRIKRSMLRKVQLIYLLS